jgi:hypothetical protein
MRMYTLPHYMKDSFLSKCVLNTRIPKKYIASKMTLDNYNRLTYPKEHV